VNETKLQSATGATGLDRRRAIVVSPHPGLRRAVVDVLGWRVNLLECSGPDGYPDAETVLQQTPDLCLIDVGTKDEQALSLMRGLTAAGTPVVALHTTNDSDLILRSLRCGAGEFLSAPIEPEQLWKAFERFTGKDNAQQPKSRIGKIWTVMPSKASYGSTTIACNLAVRLKRLEQRRVLLADMDPLVGSVGFLLKLKSPFSIMDAAGDCSNLDKDFWRKLTVPYAGIDVLLGPEEPQLDAFDPSNVQPLFQFWRESYGISIIDTPGPLSPWQIALARASDDLLLVTTNELAAVHATQRALSYLQANGVGKERVRLVVNRYQKENGLSEDAIRTALKLDIFHILPNDYAPVQAAVLDGKTVAPNSRLSKAIDELCERLTGVTRTPKKNWLPAIPSLFTKSKPG
jgi:pilus assembly protein CpaE